MYHSTKHLQGHFIILMTMLFVILQMMLHYCITEYKDVNEFLSLLAVRLGRLKKGGVPDVTRAARTVLQHWNM
jgi:ribosome biogenesis GTPase A